MILSLQVAFRHVNDYVTYAWVEDDEISSNKDSKQVSQLYFFLMYFPIAFKVYLFHIPFLLWVLYPPSQSKLIGSDIIV